MERARPVWFLAPEFWTEIRMTYHSFSFNFLHLKDWPHLKVVSMQSSARLTGSFLHSEARKLAMNLWSWIVKGEVETLSASRWNSPSRGHKLVPPSWSSQVQKIVATQFTRGFIELAYYPSNLCSRRSTWTATVTLQEAWHHHCLQQKSKQKVELLLTIRHQQILEDMDQQESIQ